jgi:YNFM family putative membrane transporter
VADGIARGTPAFRRTNLALFADGLATFALMYAVQPLMPVFSTQFGVTPAAAALALSVTTLPLAFAMLAASAVADRVGRRALMVGSLFTSALLGLACAVPSGFSGLLLLRGLMGISLAGLPAVSMAYVAEEMAPTAAGLAIGLFIAGSAVGGMSGRLLAGALTAWFGWRAALGGIGALGLACAVLLWRFLPPSRHFAPCPLRLAALGAALARHLRDPVLRLLFAQAFLLMGGFVTIYNYTAYRLLAPPYRLGQDRVGLIFSVYLAGVVSSAVMGHVAVRAGRRRTLVGNVALMACGLALTLAAPLAAIVAGTALATAGFFGAHSVASGWVGSWARSARAQASSLYLLAYYAGSSIVGSAGGLVWARWAWPGIVWLVAVLLGVSLLAATGLPARDVPASVARTQR